MTDVPDFIWATEDKENFGEDRFHSIREYPGLSPYVRRDPAVLAALPEVQALIAAAVMEAVNTAPLDWLDPDDAEAVRQEIRALTPDALAALEAYRAREVAKALEGALARVRATSVPAEWTHEGALQRGALEYAANVLSAMIPEVKP